MNNFKKLMMLTMVSIAAQQMIIASGNDNGHSFLGLGLGRRLVNTSENALTLHPIEGVKSATTGNPQAVGTNDTHFGYSDDAYNNNDRYGRYDDENDRMQANRASNYNNDSDRSERYANRKNRSNNENKKSGNKGSGSKRSGSRRSSDNQRSSGDDKRN